MTEAELKAASDKYKAELAEQTKGLIEENNKKLNDIIGAHSAVKELLSIQKALTEAKTIDEVIALKATIKTFEDTLLEMKAQNEKRKSPKATKISKDNMLHLIVKSAMLGLADMHKKGVIKEFISSRKFDLKIYTSENRINESGEVIKMVPTLGVARKVDNPMSDATSVVPIGSGVPFELTNFEPGLARVTRRKPFITQLVDLSRTMTAIVAWAEQTNIDTGTAFSISEGGAGSGTYGSFRWTENSTQVQKIQSMNKITNEMLADLPNAQNEIQTELYELLALKLDQQVLNGNGSAPQLKGILQYAQAFVNAGNLSVAGANNYDAIVAQILQVKINGVKSGITAGGEVINIFDATEIVLHPADVAQMDLTKDTLTRYVLDQQTYPTDIVSMASKAIAGLRVTENIGMTQGSSLVMDASKSHVRVREDAEIVLGYNNTDFQDNLVSVKGVLRAGHFIKSNQVNAFVSDTFANIKASIQAV